jgi:hypothetical protein
MKKCKVEENDCIICVQEYPEDGDQAGVVFINLTAMIADGSRECRNYSSYIIKAMATKQKIGGDRNFEFVYQNVSTEKYTVNPPCHVADCVTLYNC